MIKASHLKIYCEVAISSVVIRRAFSISLVVGTALNIINQGEVFFTSDMSQINVVKLLLTYIVPYCVTTYTATIINLDFQIGSLAIVDADLVCQKCHAQVHVKKGELIPECRDCKIFTKWKLK